MAYLLTIGFLLLLSRISPFLSQVINVKVGMMLPYRAPAFKQSIGFPTSAAACTIALDRIKKEHILDQVNWSFVWYFPECEESLAAGIAAKLIVEDEIDWIIGPPCSIAAIVASKMGKYYKFPLVSWAATSADLDDRTRFPTFVRTVPSSEKLGEAVAEVLANFEWNEYAIMYTDDHSRRTCYWFALGLEAAAGNRQDGKLTLKLRREIETESPKDEEFDEFLDSMPKVARISLVCLDKIGDRRQFLLRAQEKGLDTGSYLFILPEFLPNNGDEQAWMDKNDVNDGKDNEAKRAFQKMAWIMELKQADYDTVNKFKLEIPKRMKEWPWFVKDLKPDEQYGSTWSPYMHDAMYLYARALNMTLQQGNSKANGTIIAENAMKIQFDGISGHVVLNKFGSREPEFVLKGFTPQGKYEDIGYIKLLQKTNRVQLLFPEWKIFTTNDGRRPLDKPECGWRDEFCQSPITTEMILTIVGISSACLIIIIAITFFIIYQVRMEKMGQKLWKVTPAELVKIDDMLTGSSMSVESMTTTVTGLKKGQTKIGHYDIYFYRGGPAFVIKHSVQIQVKHNPDHIEWRQMSQLGHDNLNPFLGVCVEGTIMSVWKFSGKGTLQDLFEKENLNLDWFFKYSLIRDLSEGMSYLFNSAIGSHGSLTSDCCLMDDRWQLKVSDYGLISVRRAEKPKAKNLLWTSPELLRDEGGRKPALGTKPGDVYSYGIIISEILTRAKAWTALEASADAEPSAFAAVINSKVTPALKAVGKQKTLPEPSKTLATVDKSADEILYRVRKGEIPPFRPAVILGENSDVNPAVIHLMKDCLEEKPESRPDMKVIKSQLKGMVKGATNLMDHVLNMMEKYAESLEAQVNERTKELVEEKKKANLLLFRMLPKSVAEKLKVGIPIEPEKFDAATVLFSEVTTFAAISNKSTPLQVVSLLNELYNLFDGIIDSHDAYKVETISDAYLVVSGLPIRNGDKHATEMADMALGFQRAIQTIKIPHLQKEKLLVRIGLNSGPVVASVIGLAMPRYCLFGDTVNTASRMMSHGKPGKISISGECNRYLTSVIGGYKTDCRGETMVKGKGMMTTYFLLDKINEFDDDRAEPAVPAELGEIEEKPKVEKSESKESQEQDHENDGEKK